MIQKSNTPSYVNLRQGEWEKRIREANQMLANCHLCPHGCGVNRLDGQIGKCHSTSQLEVSSYNPHFGEEPPLSGNYGSGTVFFTYCTLRCVYCQNYPISQLGNGNPVSVSDLAKIMLDLQDQRCHNINLVTPTHFVPHILTAVREASQAGLKIPLVYNTSGYETKETLQLLDGIIDIYLPDIKYAEEDIACRYSRAEGYFPIAKEALLEMFRQVGNLRLNHQGIAVSGLMIRHLILPNQLAGTDLILPWIAKNLSREIYVSLMTQYFPAHQAIDDPVLGRKINRIEYQKAKHVLEGAGLLNGWIQQFH